LSAAAEPHRHRLHAHSSIVSNAWGIPRSTHDPDFVIQLPPSEIPKFVAAFQGAYYIDETTLI
jgi:hypothetical protein